MDAVDDIKRLIDEAQQEVRDRVPGRRCWGLHTWTAWVDFSRYQERRCAWCNRVDRTAIAKCAHAAWETLSVSEASRGSKSVGTKFVQECVDCGEPRAIVKEWKIE